MENNGQTLHQNGVREMTALNGKARIGSSETCMDSEKTIVSHVCAECGTANNKALISGGGMLTCEVCGSGAQILDTLDEGDEEVLS